jgi:uncharacterized membrane protein (DUF485 family)
MEQQPYLRIQQDPNFQALVAKRQRFAWTLSILMLGLYLAFILLIAFAPGWLGTPLSEGSSITRGIPVGIGLIVSAFVLTGIYVFRANGEFDELNQKILKLFSRLQTFSCKPFHLCSKSILMNTPEQFFHRFCSSVLHPAIDKIPHNIIIELFSGMLILFLSKG